MKILHIASISEDMTSGVNAVVPKHIAAQGKYADVYFYNINGLRIQAIGEKQITVSKQEELFDFIRCNIDLIVFHEAYRPIYLSISRFLRTYNIPYIIIPHCELSNEAQKRKWLKKKVANLLFFNRFINHAAQIQCLSQLELSTTKFKASKFIGTNGMELKQNIKTEFYNGDIVYIGRLDLHHKGIDIMISGVTQCADMLRSQGIKLNIYGPNIHGRAEKIKKLINKNNVNDIIKLHGPVLDSEKEELLLKCRFFMQTSRVEGMPMGILEALAYGVPCLITEGTTLGDVVRVENAGWVAETKPHSVSQAIVRAFNAQDYDEKSKNARRLIEEQFQWDVIAKKTIEIYKRCKVNEVD